MSGIKEKALLISLELFNKNGVETVSMRDIAAKLQISVGNLTYHFPAKNDLLYALCIQCIDEIDKTVAAIVTTNSENVFAMAFAQVEAIFLTQLKYKFIFNKRYAEIVTSLPKVQEHYQKVLKVRFNEWHIFHELLVKQKLADPTLIEDTNAIGYIFNMLALFWHQESAIYMPESTDKQKVQHALSIFFHVYKPYLTKKGLSQLMPLIKAPKRY